MNGVVKLIRVYNHCETYTERFSSTFVGPYSCVASHAVCAFS